MAKQGSGHPATGVVPAAPQRGGGGQGSWKGVGPFSSSHSEHRSHLKLGSEQITIPVVVSDESGVSTGSAW